MRHDLLHLTLDVPDDDTLLAWAADAFKALAGEVVFYHATQLVAHETIAFATGQCVGYHETFESGAGRDGAYVCQLTITAPSFELRSGGPAAVAAIVMPTQRLGRAVQQAGEVVQYAEQIAAVVREVAHEALGRYSLHAPSTHFVRPAAALDWALFRQQYGEQNRRSTSNSACLRVRNDRCASLQYVRGFRE